MKRFKPTIWLSLGLVSLTLLSVMTAHITGILPDGYKTALNSRAKIAESLAVQLAAAANNNDGYILKNTLETVVERNEDVLSAALRKADGTLVISAGDHEATWVAPEDGRSTPSHIIVPLNGPSGPQGAIEIHFDEANSIKQVLGIPITLLWFMAFIGTFGFLGYFILLRRALKQLNPGRVMPKRVQRAFDTLTEGVIMVDEHECILLMNNAFSSLYEGYSAPKLGSKINALGWRMTDGNVNAGAYPWHEALKTNDERKGDLLSLRTPDGSIYNFQASASVITGDNDKALGAIVTLSDTTNNLRIEDELEKAREALSEFQTKAKRKDEELAYLNAHDPLSGCLSRNSFMERLDGDLAKTSQNNGFLALLHVDLDNFHRFNQDYGHATGNRALNIIGTALRDIVSSNGYVSRHSGDEFCIVIPGANAASLNEFANILLQRITQDVKSNVAGGVSLTASIGLADVASDGAAAASLLNRANQALRYAKDQGGNQACLWDAQAIKALVESNGTPNSEIVQTAKPSSDINPSVAFEFEIEERIVELNQHSRRMALIHVSVNSWDYLLEALGTEGGAALISQIRMRAVRFMTDRDKAYTCNTTGTLKLTFSKFEEKNQLEQEIQELLAAFGAPFTIEGQEIYIAASAGIATFPDDGGTAERLLANAASAVYRAGESKKSEVYRFYNADMVQASQKRLVIESGIREALQRDQFELFFQPIVNLQTGALSAAECLLRCNCESMKGIFIDQIIDVAEQTALISKIDFWVVSNALAQMAVWERAGLRLPKISINISAAQFVDVPFIDKVYAAIRTAPFEPNRVQIEITETARIDDINLAAPQIKRLQQLGVIMALDDFGTGLASLSYLQRLHPDVLKIDRAFITDVNSNHASATMVSAMTVMAHCMGLSVVVEGVETEAEMNFLRDTKCDDMQGYFLSKPMPVKAMTDWMRMFRPRNSESSTQMTNQEPELVEPTVTVTKVA